MFGKKPKARILNNTMIVSLPDAIEPVVWQFDFNKHDLSAVKVRTTDNAFHIVLTTDASDKNGDKIIAQYDDIGLATRALDIISGAAGGAAPSAFRLDSFSLYGFLMGSMKIILMLLAILLLFFIILTVFIPAEWLSTGDTQETATSVPSIEPSGEIESGVPQDAEEFLKNLEQQ